MLQFFARRLGGYAPNEVTRAFQRLQGEHEAERTRLQDEIAAARLKSRELSREWARLSARLSEVEDQVQQEMLALMRAQSQTQESLEQAAVRHARQREELTDQIQRQEQILGQMQKLQIAFATELRLVATRYQQLTAAEDLASLIPTRVANTGGGNPQPGRVAGDGR